MEKLNVKRCPAHAMEYVGYERAQVDALDRAQRHLWSSEPHPEITELGPVIWWLCGRCPARVLHDPETDDGMPVEPIVVYPPSCFDPGPLRGCREQTSRDDGCCGCPRRASGDVVHLEWCVQTTNAEIREIEEASFTGPLSLAIVHPPTDPAPPSEELARAIDDDREEVIAQLMADTGCSREQAEHDLDETLRMKATENAEDEEPPTVKRITPVAVESASSIFERVEALFGRPVARGDAAGTDLALDALGGFEG